jgi:hypothetical protein
MILFMTNVVFGPTNPAADDRELDMMPWAIWKDMTAFLVSGPKKPVTFEASRYPSLARNFCRTETDAPEAFGETGVTGAIEGAIGAEGVAATLSEFRYAVVAGPGASMEARDEAETDPPPEL